jgi:hypothetical protein
LEPTYGKNLKPQDHQMILITMLQQKSLKELIALVQNLQSSLEKMNPDKRQPLFSQDDSLILNSNAPEVEKKKWLISKMVLLRTAIFSEYSNRIHPAEEENDFEKATNYMNEYIFNYALPFIDKLKAPSRFDKLSAWLNNKSVLTPYEYLEKWKTDYASFRQIKTSDSKLDFHWKSEKYRSLVTTYSMLSTLSFSKDNVPESQAFVIIGRNVVVRQASDGRSNIGKNYKNQT